jgi:hypothetical protein
VQPVQRAPRVVLAQVQGVRVPGQPAVAGQELPSAGLSGRLNSESATGSTTPDADLCVVALMATTSRIGGDRALGSEPQQPTVTQSDPEPGDGSPWVATEPPNSACPYPWLIGPRLAGDLSHYSLAPFPRRPRPLRRSLALAGLALRPPSGVVDDFGSDLTVVRGEVSEAHHRTSRA